MRRPRPRLLGAAIIAILSMFVAAEDDDDDGDDDDDEVGDTGITGEGSPTNGSVLHPGWYWGWCCWYDPGVIPTGSRAGRKGGLVSTAPSPSPRRSPRPAGLRMRRMAELRGLLNGLGLASMGLFAAAAEEKETEASSTASSSCCSRSCSAACKRAARRGGWVGVSVSEGATARQGRGLLANARERCVHGAWRGVALRWLAPGGPTLGAWVSAYLLCSQLPLLHSL